MNEQTLSANVSAKANLIWAIADKLTGVYKPHEYGEVILPLTVIRRFDAVLADTKQAVIAKNKEIPDGPLKEKMLCRVAGHPFFNISPFTFETLVNSPERIEENFRAYLNGFFRKRASNH